jgi:hypothetical protein
MLIISDVQPVSCSDITLIYCYRESSSEVKRKLAMLSYVTLYLFQAKYNSWDEYYEHVRNLQLSSRINIKNEWFL